VRHDVVLSEEGGRFYHEQNRNIILYLAAEELPTLPKGYFMVDYKTLVTLLQVNNVLNIQLRNLLSLLEV
jgi:oxidase EvaA